MSSLSHCCYCLMDGHEMRQQLPLSLDLYHSAICFCMVDRDNMERWHMMSHSMCCCLLDNNQVEAVDPSCCCTALKTTVTLQWWRLLANVAVAESSLPPLSGGRQTLSSMDDNNFTLALISAHQLIWSNFVVAIVAVSLHAFNLTFCALNSILKYNKFQIAFCLPQNSSFFWKIVRKLFLDGMRNLIHYVANKSIVS